MGSLLSLLRLEDRAETYRERASYYRQRAEIESLKSSAFIDEEGGSELVDIIETAAIDFPDGRAVELAKNSDGVYFAKIEGKKYYPINISLVDELLEKAETYEKLSHRFWRRLMREPYQLIFDPLDRLFFSIFRSIDDISDHLFPLNLLMEQRIRQLRFQDTEDARRFREAARKLCQK